MMKKIVTRIQTGAIHRNGFRRRLRFANDEELVALLTRLIGEGYLFVDQPAGWPPAAILRDLRSKGQLNLKFKTITWAGPGEESIDNGS
jgi:hypothetical protein